MNNEIWKKPVIQDLGNAEEIVKSIDTDGSGDSNFPINLSSPN